MELLKDNRILILFDNTLMTPLSSKFKRLSLLLIANSLTTDSYCSLDRSFSKSGEILDF